MKLTKIAYFFIKIPLISWSEHFWTVIITQIANFFIQGDTCVHPLSRMGSQVFQSSLVQSMWTKMYSKVFYKNDENHRICLNLPNLKFYYVSYLLFTDQNIQN